MKQITSIVCAEKMQESVITGETLRAMQQVYDNGGETAFVLKCEHQFLRSRVVSLLREKGYTVDVANDRLFMDDGTLCISIYPDVSERDEGDEKSE